jgi:hypothetical protein
MAWRPLPLYALELPGSRRSTVLAEIFLCLNSISQLKVELTAQVHYVWAGSIRTHENQVHCVEKWVQFSWSSGSKQKINELRFGFT